MERLVWGVSVEASSEGGQTSTPHGRVCIRLQAAVGGFMIKALGFGRWEVKGQRPCGICNLTYFDELFLRSLSASPENVH